jgi:hypothetical protein
MNKRKKKRRIIFVGKPPALISGQTYEGVIRSIEVDEESHYYDIAIENLDPTQSGRIHDVRLPTMLFPGSKMARFLAAAGQEANTIKKRIDLDDVVGTVVGMRFPSPDGSGEQIEFERIQAVTEDNASVLAADQEAQALV